MSASPPEFVILEVEQREADFAGRHTRPFSFAFVWEGHGFSRAVSDDAMTGALAPEVSPSGP